MAKKVSEELFAKAATTKPTVAQALMDDTKEKKADKYPVRVNFGFTQENADYLKIMSKLCDKSITEFMNDLLDDDRTMNQDTVDAATQLMDNLRNRRAQRRNSP